MVIQKRGATRAKKKSQKVTKNAINYDKKKQRHCECEWATDCNSFNFKSWFHHPERKSFNNCTQFEATFVFSVYTL